MKPIYHYTTGNKLAAILEAEEITPATTGVEPPEIPAVWLSVAPVWERTATKGIIEDGERRDATLAEMVTSDGSLVRIEIDPRRVVIIPPLKLREGLRMRRAVLDGLVAGARRMGGNPMEWRAVAGPIPLAAFARIELAKETDPIRWIDSHDIAEG